jgi:hypothetical protein
MRESRTYGSVRGARDEIGVPTATGVDGPLRHQCAKLVFSENHQERKPSMSEITQVHGSDAEATTVLRRRLRRNQVLAFFSRVSSLTTDVVALTSGGRD